MHFKWKINKFKEKENIIIWMTETLKWKLCRSQFFLAWINGGGHRKMNFGDDQSGEFFFFNSESCLTVIFSSVFNVILSRMSFYFWKKVICKNRWVNQEIQISTINIRRLFYFLKEKKRKRKMIKKIPISPINIHRFFPFVSFPFWSWTRKFKYQLSSFL